MITLNKRRVSVWNDSETFISKIAKLKRRRKARVAEQGFDPWTSGLWAQHASTAPLCYVTSNKERKKCTKKQRKVVCICPCVTFGLQSFQTEQNNKSHIRHVGKYNEGLIDNSFFKFNQHGGYCTRSRIKFWSNPSSLWRDSNSRPLVY